MLARHGVLSGLAWLNFTKSYMLHPNFSSSSVLRRQDHLVRTLCGCNAKNRRRKIVRAMSSGGISSEADADSVLRTLTPVLDPKLHKGQAGKIAIIGGCREYTGAPYFAAISALKIGADLSHVFCTKDAAPVIKSYSPELIVHPVLEESYSLRDFDLFQECVSKIMKLARESNIPFVVDGDGLFLITDSINLVSDYPLAVLTPNVNEYKRLVQKVLNCEVNEQNAQEQLCSLAREIGGVTILRKGKSDLISDGKTVKSVSIYGSPRRCGGQGDILSGSVAVFLSWARQLSSPSEAKETVGSSSENPAISGCVAASGLLRKAALLAFEKKKRSTLTSDIIDCLGESLEDICPVS
ncbi:PREDICTED: ATP-dependent (S)-NAD(P)H-hydrate dehydratase isoform X2 [Tarenaya hassleriana]|uniref:ATP-dependent (S)-NAD(P)H-hydrate dehydratase isoform X2 n=1 Tax=Tarenaya hassleriana TaxID=28532 RepID=UPI0008FCF8E1|nr:PREDICTED: ATP-dependent (S)-NAD(P)H-hydrate dehydratase isoform X2 [Tarenaya hassleriana]